MVYSNSVLFKGIQDGGVNVCGQDLEGRDGEDGECEEEKRIDKGVHVHVRASLAHPGVSDMTAGKSRPFECDSCSESRIYSFKAINCFIARNVQIVKPWPDLLIALFHPSAQMGTAQL